MVRVHVQRSENSGNNSLLRLHSSRGQTEVTKFVCKWLGEPSLLTRKIKTVDDQEPGLYSQLSKPATTRAGLETQSGEHHLLSTV